MLARAQSSVLALAALIALGACASVLSDRPSQRNSNRYQSENPRVNNVNYLSSTEFANFISNTKLPINPDIISTEVIPLDKNSEKVGPPKIGSTPETADPSPTVPSQDLRPEAPTPDPEVTPSAVPELFRNESRPVNLRYPHAVLFGGTCGGTIIHPKWILTAGHCTLFTGGRYVLAGTNNSEDGSGISVKVKKLYIHPLFTVGPYWLNANNYDIQQVGARWDFLLAELDEYLDLDGVKIAAAPLEDHTKIAPNTYVGYAGYGADHHGGFMRPTMHAMHLRVQSDKVCKKLEQFNGKDMLCAQGYAPHFDSACNGDSGSGLVSGNGKLIGVASWVERDAIECKPGNLVVFSKVASVRNWIRSVAGV